MSLISDLGTVYKLGRYIVRNNPYEFGQENGCRLGIIGCTGVGGDLIYRCYVIRVGGVKGILEEILFIGA